MRGSLVTNTILLVEDEEALSSYLVTELQFEDYQVFFSQRWRAGAESLR